MGTPKKKRKPEVPKRPEKLPGSRKCRECVFYTSYHSDFKGNCQEAFGVGRRHGACVKFDLAIDPKRYRKDPDIAALLEQAAEFDGVDAMLAEVQALASDGVFAAFKERGDRLKMVTAAADLLEEGSSNTAPLFERVQRIRDVAILIQTAAREQQARAMSLWGTASSTLYRKYREVQNVKPVDVRNTLTGEILQELEDTTNLLETVITNCETVIRNAQSAHSALLEIQAIHNTNPAPFRRSSGTRGSRGGRQSKGTWIRRKQDA